MLFQAIVAAEGPPPLPDVSRSGTGSCALGAKKCSMKRTEQTITCLNTCNMAEAGHETRVLKCRVRFSHSAFSNSLGHKDCSHLGMGLIKAGDDVVDRVNGL